MVKADPSRTSSDDPAFEVFAANEAVATRREALTALIRGKLIPKHADDNRFQRGFHALAATAGDTNQSVDDRLWAIAEVIRVAQVVKRLQPKVPELLAAAFAEPIPPLPLLKDADARLNVARACALFRADWLPEYLARAIADEEQGESARVELIAALSQRSESVAAMLLRLREALAGLRPTTEQPGETVARRLTRVLAALRSVIPSTDLEAGDDIGLALHGMMVAPFRSVEAPKDEKVLVELAREAMLLTHEVVRTRFSVATDAAMFKAVAHCRRLLGGGFWPTELEPQLSLLIKDVREALVLLGRQHVRDQQLLGQLDMLTNSSQRARFLAREIAERHPELDEDTRDWLLQGRLVARRESSATAQESAARGADEAIGLALEAARHAQRASQSLRESLLSTLEIYEPGQVSVTADCFARVDALILQVEHAAAQRGLTLYGNPGEEVDYSPKFFQPIVQAERQRMIVRQPAVVRTRKDGTIGETVVKGLVE